MYNVINCFWEIKQGESSIKWNFAGSLIADFQLPNL